MKDLLASGLEAAAGSGRGKAFLRHFDVQVPTLTVVTTDLFEAFMAENRLWDVVHAGEPDHRIALAFQAANLPVELLGDLYALTRQVHTPLAVRSSSLLEDALNQPFAGVYATKMIPNNQHDVETRFHKLVEAVKFVYASTFFANARDYRRLTGHKEEDRMAVILQAIVGRRYRDRFYPELSGVARSYSFYRSGNTRPEDGVINLAFGLGKTIVDGGVTWSCSPAQPRATPPYASVRDLLRQTQVQFWAVNMGKPPAYDPVEEAEYLVQSPVADAEEDGTLRLVASTYDAGVGPPVDGRGRPRPARAQLRAAAGARGVRAQRPPQGADGAVPGGARRAGRDRVRGDVPARRRGRPGDVRVPAGPADVGVGHGGGPRPAVARPRHPAPRLGAGDGQRPRLGRARRRLREAGRVRRPPHAGHRGRHRADQPGPGRPGHSRIC